MTTTAPETERAWDFDTAGLVAYSGLPASWWYRTADEVPHFRIARKLYWRKADIDAYLSAFVAGPSRAD